MGRPIIEIRNPADDTDRRLLIWSTVVDAPITYGMTEAALREYIKEEEGQSGLRELDDRLERVRTKGTSSYDDATWQDTIRFNRAGPNETELDIAGIWAAYADAPKDE